MYLFDKDGYDSDERYQDKIDMAYDEMIDDFFMMQDDNDREVFIHRYGQEVYDKLGGKPVQLFFVNIS